MMGHLPMLRYAVEKLGANPAHVNTYGMCPLQMACRFGNERCLRFLATRLDSSQINYQSGGLGISPLSDAAKCAPIPAPPFLLRPALLPLVACAPAALWVLIPSHTCA